MARPKKIIKKGMLSNIMDNMSNYWTMKNGDSVAIKDLRKTHITNILDMMEKNPYWRHEYKSILIAELRRRKEAQFIRKSKAGKILYAKA